MSYISKIACALMTALFIASAHAAEIKLLASPAVKAALDELIPQFEKTSGHTVAAEYGTAAALRTMIEKNAVFDLAMLNTMSSMLC